MSEDMAEGKLEDVLAQDTVNRVEIEHNGKKFWFDMKVLSWNERMDSLNSNMNREHDERTGEESMNVNHHEYIKDMLRKKIQDSNIDNINTMLEGMSQEFGDKLAEHVDDSAEILSEEEKGN